MGIVQHMHTVINNMVYAKSGELAEIIDDVNVKTIPIRYC